MLNQKIKGPTLSLELRAPQGWGNLLLLNYFIFTNTTSSV